MTHCIRKGVKQIALQIITHIAPFVKGFLKIRGFILLQFR